jgi:hypothetical protein
MQTTRRRLWGQVPRDHLHFIDITTQHINDQDIENKYSKEVMANSDAEDKVDVSDFRSHHLSRVEATLLSSWFAIANANATSNHHIHSNKDHHIPSSLNHELILLLLLLHLPPPPSSSLTSRHLPSTSQSLISHLTASQILPLVQYRHHNRRNLFRPRPKLYPRIHSRTHRTSLVTNLDLWC